MTLISSLLKYILLVPLQYLIEVVTVQYKVHYTVAVPLTRDILYACGWRNGSSRSYFKKVDSNNNKCSDRSMKVKLPALLVNYDRPTDLVIGKFHFQKSLEEQLTWNIQHAWRTDDPQVARSGRTDAVRKGKCWFRDATHLNNLLTQIVWWTLWSLPTRSLHSSPSTSAGILWEREQAQQLKYTSMSHTNTIL